MSTTHPHQLPIRLHQVEISLNGQQLLEIDHEVAPGDVLTIMGPSGAGKSTLLAYICGFLDRAFIAKGQVYIGDEELTALPAESRRMGILFQEPLLFPHMSVEGNLLFALPAGGTPDKRRNQAEKALEQVGLADIGKRDPDTLSGGQKARVALARVLIARPRALLLDEPFSKLDAALRDQMRTLVFDQARMLGLPVILVTHDASDAKSAGGTVLTVG